MKIHFFKSSLWLSLLLLLVSCAPIKGPDYYWAGKKWILMEMNGIPVQISNTDKDAHLQFVPSNKTFSGSGGCNRITGGYKLDKQEKIRFENVGATRLLCDNQAFEDFFLSTIKTINQYSIEDQILLLKRDGIIVLKLK